MGSTEPVEAEYGGHRSDTSYIDSGHVRLSLREFGPEDAPTVVLLHGYPDTGEVWDSVVAALAEDFHVFVPDMRGAGYSSAPANRSAYQLRRLIDDVANVITHVEPAGKPVHLIGHDWGSVQAWGAVLRENKDARLMGRIASFTSISGPPLPLFARFFSSELSKGRINRLARQLSRSWYIGAFQLPWVPELVMRGAGVPLRKKIGKTQHRHHASWSKSFTDDAVNGINLYRANIAAGGFGPISIESSAWRPTKVPVQLIVPLHDRFILPLMYESIDIFAADISRTDIATGHWPQLSLPRLTADLVAQHIRRHDN